MKTHNDQYIQRASVSIHVQPCVAYRRYPLLFNAKAYPIHKSKRRTLIHASSKECAHTIGVRLRFLNVSHLVICTTSLDFLHTLSSTSYAPPQAYGSRGRKPTAIENCSILFTSPPLFCDDIHRLLINAYIEVLGQCLIYI